MKFTLKYIFGKVLYIVENVTIEEIIGDFIYFTYSPVGVHLNEIIALEIKS
jgi:hypothetical protein